MRTSSSISLRTVLYASVAAATLPAATLPENLSLIALITDSSFRMPETAAKPPSSGTFGTGRPTWRSEISVAATVHKLRRMAVAHQVGQAEFVEASCWC